MFQYENLTHHWATMSLFFSTGYSTPAQGLIAAPIKMIHDPGPLPPYPNPDNTARLSLRSQEIAILAPIKAACGRAGE